MTQLAMDILTKPRLVRVVSNDNDRPSQLSIVRDSFLKHPGTRWTAYQLALAVGVVVGRKVSDSGITARIRDLRKPQHGGLDIRCAKLPGQESRVYWLEP